MQSANLSWPWVPVSTGVPGKNAKFVGDPLGWYGSPRPAIASCCCPPVTKEKNMHIKMHRIPCATYLVRELALVGDIVGDGTNVRVEFRGIHHIVGQGGVFCL